MAARVDALARSERRSSEEIRPISAQLRQESPITLVLDQEYARAHGGTLLTATSPLAMAAAAVPAHRQARFASLRITADPEKVPPGTYVVVLAVARTTHHTTMSSRGDEIWGAAVTDTGRLAGEGPADALLAALAEGRLNDAPLPPIDRLGKLAERAMTLLRKRHHEEQQRRDAEFEALREARLLTIHTQHERKLAAIQRRIDSARSRGRGLRSIELFVRQARIADEKYAELRKQIESAKQPEIRLEPVAACVVHIRG